MSQQQHMRLQGQINHIYSYTKDAVFLSHSSYIVRYHSVILNLTLSVIPFMFKFVKWTSLKGDFWMNKYSGVFSLFPDRFEPAEAKCAHPFGLPHPDFRSGLWLGQVAVA